MIYTGIGRVGEIADVKANGGADVAEVYGGIGESNPIFYSRKSLVGTSPLTFKGLGQPLKDYHIFGETVQDGMPSPDYPVDVHGCGEWSESILDLNREYYNGFTLDTTKWMKGGSSTKYSGDAYLVDASITDAKIVVNSKNAGYGVSVFIPAKPNTKYSIYWICNKTTEQGHEQISVSSRDSNGNATGVKSFHDPSVYETESNAKYLNVVFRCRPFYGEVEYSDILICESDTVVPYGYKIPVTIRNVTTPIYIGTAQTTRKIKKLVLTGSESYTYQSQYSRYVFTVLNAFADGVRLTQCFCTHYRSVHNGEPIDDIPDKSIYINYQALGTQFCIKDKTITSLADFKSYLAAQYANGTPVTIWYILASEETGIVNEPFHRIGDYADTISMTQAGTSMPTVAGVNTLTVDTTVKPSAVSITGHIKPTGYGQLLDVNDVDIQDSTGEPIYIQG